MTDYSQKTCAVVDNGLFVETAVVLAKTFGRVLYYAPWESSFPKSNPLLTGQGLDGVERIESIWPYLEEVDLWIFPDIYFGTLQLHLEKLGKRVWGARMGEELEIYRKQSKEHQKELGIDIGPYEIVKGMDELRAHLKEHENVYVKISKTRGDMETFHSVNYKLIEPRLDELEHALGAKKTIVEFVVEEAIEPAVETGYDGYTIDGKFPDTGIVGIEIKDQCYVANVQSYADMPKQVTSVNEKLASTLARYRYRGFISTELRVTPEGKSYSIDPCCRQGSPPSEIYISMIANLPDVMWSGAEGELVEPDFTHKWAAELLLHSSWADTNWQAISFPDELRDSIKLRFATRINGEYYVVPQATGCPEVGAVIGMGDTMEAAIEQCKENAEQVKGYYIESHVDAFDEAKDRIKKLEEQGMWHPSSGKKGKAPKPRREIRRQPTNGQRRPAGNGLRLEPVDHDPFGGQ